jgi:LPXTG-motif cell wall-anchored protein
VIRRTLAAVAIGATCTIALAAPAAATDDTIPVKSDCNSGWYVNADEGDLLPEQVEGGFLFDGPSLVHHAMEPTKLTDLPKHALLDAEVIEGVAPPVKFETTKPNSTININYAGLYWSSEIAPSDPGGQSHPVAEPGDLEALAPYTADTRVVTFGFGYGTDTGNKALVKSITFAGKTYDLTCKPSNESPSPSASTPAGGAGGATTPPAGEGEPLPVTGSSVATGAGIGAALLAAGAVLFVLFRRRKVRFTTEG